MFYIYVFVVVVVGTSLFKMLVRQVFEWNWSYHPNLRPFPTTKQNRQRKRKGKEEKGGNNVKLQEIWNLKSDFLPDSWHVFEYDRSPSIVDRPCVSQYLN